MHLAAFSATKWERRLLIATGRRDGLKTTKRTGTCAQNATEAGTTPGTAKSKRRIWDTPFKPKNVIVAALTSKANDNLSSAAPPEQQYERGVHYSPPFSAQLGKSLTRCAAAAHFSLSFCLLSCRSPPGYFYFIL